MRLAGFDVEATCLDARRCRIVAAALVPIRGDTIALGEALYAVAGDGVRSSRESALVHGIVGGEAHVEPNTSLRRLLEEAARYTLVTYGPHDARFVVYEASRMGLVLEKLCYIDVLESILSSPVLRAEAAQQGGYVLEHALQRHVGLEPPPRRLHDPLEDALYVTLLYLALLKRGFPLRRRCIGLGGGRRALAGLLRRVARLLGPRSRAPYAEALSAPSGAHG